MPTRKQLFLFSPTFSNRLLHHKKVGVVWGRAFDILNKHKALAGAVGVGNKKGGNTLSVSPPVWWSLLESNQPPTDYESVALTE